MLRYSQYSYVALIVLSFLVYGQESDNPSPTPTETSQKEQDYPASKDHETERNETVTENIPVVINTSPPIKTAGQKDEDSSNSNDESSPNGWDLHLIFSGVVALFTIVLGVSTLGLWWFTRKAAIAAADTVKSMDDTAERQLRAYMDIDKIERTDDPSQLGHPVFNTEIINTGQTPAHEVKFNIWISFREYPLERELDKPEILMPPSSSTFGAGQAGNSQINIGRPITKDEIQMMNKKEGAFYIYGEIRYRDVFLKHRYTNFIFCYLGEKAMPKIQTYKEGNEAT